MTVIFLARRKSDRNKNVQKDSAKKGGVYRKSDLIEDLNGFENMASAYYDPARSNDLHYRHRREPKLTRCNKWELHMERHIFLREKEKRENEPGLSVCAGLAWRGGNSGAKV
ncbi:MAG: hypothetical protein LBG94_00535 [Treponema sp.]|nr:hypothetical protein [Treponema sp.]